MPSNLQQIAARAKARGDSAKRGMERKVVTAALVTAREVITETPVDTGRARSAWVGSKNAPSPTSPAQPYFPYPQFTDPEKKFETANRDAAIEQVSGAFAGHDLSDTLYLTNHVDYLPKLNAGASRQTDAGFVETASVAGRAVARKLGGFA